MSPPRPRHLLPGLLVALLALTPTTCGTTAGSTVIRVSRQCAAEAGQEALPTAMSEVETAVAQASLDGALGLLERLAVQYGVDFVSCYVAEISREATARLAQGADLPLERTRERNSRAWLARHPVP